VSSDSTTSLPERPAPKLSPVNRQKLADLAYEAIRRSIVAGDFPMASRLVETKLAEQLGMSRAPVREALRRLLEEGLVSERPHHGTFVRTFAADDIIDLYNVRLALEATALRLFVRRGASTAPLREQIARRRAAAEDGDVSAVVAADFAFHEEVFRGSGNAILYDLFRNLAAQTLIAIALGDAAPARFAEEHVPIVEALERADEDGAVGEFVRVVVSTVQRVAAKVGGDWRGLVVPADPA
jgi:DNA-binding GntR family transcriptional regulator